jgi:hypothetical protein
LGSGGTNPVFVDENQAYQQVEGFGRHCRHSWPPAVIGYFNPIVAAQFLIPWRGRPRPPAEHLISYPAEPILQFVEEERQKRQPHGDEKISQAAALAPAKDAHRLTPPGLG